MWNAEMEIARSSRLSANGSLHMYPSELSMGDLRRLELAQDDCRWIRNCCCLMKSLPASQSGRSVRSSDLLIEKSKDRA